MRTELRVVTGFYMRRFLHFSSPLLLIFFKLELQLLSFTEKRLKLLIKTVGLFFMHLADDTHVLAQSIVLLFEESVLLLELDIAIEKPSGLFVTPGCTETRLSLGHNPFHDSGFLDQS
jgi:hypothetical protein